MSNIAEIGDEIFCKCKRTKKGEPLTYLKVNALESGRLILLEGIHL